MPQLVVAKDGSGDYRSIQAAINAIRVEMSEEHEVLIRNGIYTEKIEIADNQTNIRLVGESTEGTVINFGYHAAMRFPDGTKYGTFRTPTMTISGDGCQLENITVANTAGYGEGVGQALALYLAGDRTTLKNVRLLGNQDTLYTAKGRHYVKDSYIEGHVDFIFGAATVLFDNCEIHSLRKGFITAASTTEETEFGYVFRDCRLTGAADEHSVFLGRPWRPFAQTVFINTWMGPHIKPEGWDNWRNPDNEKTARFAEYGSTGPGATPELRASWARQLTQEEAEAITPERIFAGKGGWKPIL